MPAYEAQTLQRTSSAMFFKLGVDAYHKNQGLSRAADRAVQACLDHYIIPERDQALDRAHRLFKRCVREQGDFMARSAVWFGTIGCLRRRVPDFVLAREIKWGRSAPDLAQMVTDLVPRMAAQSTLGAEQFQRYVSAPMLAFFNRIDLDSVWALGACRACSAQEVTMLHRLYTHPLYEPVQKMLEHGLPAASDSDADTASELGSSDADSDADSMHSDRDARFDAASSDGGHVVAVDARQKILEDILAAFGLADAAQRVLERAPGAVPELASHSSAELARDYVADVAQSHLAEVANQDLEGFLNLLRDPLCARVREPAALLSAMLAGVGDLLAEGLQESSRKRVRDDATDCAAEVA